MDGTDVSDVHAEARERAADRRFRSAHGDVPTLSRCAALEDREKCGCKERPQTEDPAAESGTDGKNSKVLETLPQRRVLVFVEEPGHENTLARSEEHTSELQSPCNLVCR